MALLKLFNGALGINNKVPAYRLPYSQETGVAALEAATDVMVDRTGAITGRLGSEEIEAGDFHSLFPGKEWGLVAKDRTSDTALYRVTVSETPTITLNGIWSGMVKGAWIDFCRVNNAIFFTNGYGTGMISQDAVVSDWQTSVWADSASIAGFTAPPASHHLCFNAGRIYFSINNMIHYTEFAHLGLYNPAIGGEQFATKILAIAPAADGIYVSDSDAIYFLSGLNPHKWTNRKVADYPAKEWGKFHGTVDPSFFGFETNVPSSLLATESGPVICLPGGRVENLIGKNVTMPDCPAVGAISVFDETLVVQSHE